MSNSTKEGSSLSFIRINFSLSSLAHHLIHTRAHWQTSHGFKVCNLLVSTTELIANLQLEILMLQSQKGSAYLWGLWHVASWDNSLSRASAFRILILWLRGKEHEGCTFGWSILNVEKKWREWSLCPVGTFCEYLNCSRIVILHFSQLMKKVILTKCDKRKQYYICFCVLYLFDYIC